jgi:hypothetical protein
MYYPWELQTLRHLQHRATVPYFIIFITETWRPKRHVGGISCDFAKAVHHNAVSTELHLIAFKEQVQTG